MSQQLQIERPGWLEDINSMLISTAVHLTLFIAIGLIATGGTDGARKMTLLVSAADGEETGSFDDAPLGSAAPMKIGEDPGAAMGPVKMFDTSALAPGGLSDLNALAESSGVASGIEGPAWGGLTANGVEGPGLGGSGTGKGRAGAASTEFFGIGGYGQTFVYVVDASGSMSENRKFERACYELLQSIEQLKSDQKYFVIFYNDRAYPMETQQPVFATQNEIAKTVKWVNGASPNGGTNPLPALLYALSLRPDAIYFLSDGQFDPMTMQELRNRNRPKNRQRTRQVPIHTIAFVDRSMEAMMRAIAKNSGGQYRFVQ